MIHSSCSGSPRATDANRRRLALEDRDQQIRRGRRRERRASGDELVEDDAEAVAIRSSVDRQPARLLGRHVGDRADDHARAGLDRRRDRRRPHRRTSRRRRAKVATPKSSTLT